MGFIVVIPARFASTRLPGKPLLDIAGKPMIQHVWQRACESNADAVYIATDHPDIEQAAKGFGAQVCMTKASHESGTDRLQEVVSLLQLAPEQVLVNVQGDEPLIPPAVINQVAALMQADVQMASLYETINKAEQVFDPNVVKVVTNQAERALYFSRAPIPWYRDGFAANNATLPSTVMYKRHIGIYGYRASLLNQFVQWPMADIEATEKLEQLRAMSHGIAIQMAEACATIPAGVDTQQDLDKVRQLLAGDSNGG